MVYSPPAGPPPVYDNGTSAAGIELGTPVRAMGAGAETRDAWLLSHVTYSLPGVTLKDQSVTAISFRHLEPTSGHRMDGVLGADFLK